MKPSKLKDIYSHKIDNINLADEFIWPKYIDQSILNIPSTICNLLDISPLAPLPLRKEMLPPLENNIENVVFVLVDALAYHRLQKWMDDDANMVWHRFSEKGTISPITSIAPSTTSSAISTYWSGASAASHGVVGYETWLKEFGVTANMILHRPISFKSGIGSLELAGFSPDTFLPVDKFGTHLLSNDVAAHSFQHYTISQSGLSRTFLHNAQIHGTSTLPDVWISVREMLESNKGRKTYSWVYWGDMDGTAHIYGPDAERSKADFEDFGEAFERYFLGRIGKDISENTAVIFSADHGQITTDKHADHYDLNNHPKFAEMLHINPTGENRLAFLHAKPGKIEELIDYTHEVWPGDFSILRSGEALQNGLFGPGPFHQNIENRIGDLVVIAKNDAFLWWGNKANPIIGRHGGLSEQEMIVPIMTARLSNLLNDIYNPSLSLNRF